MASPRKRRCTSRLRWANAWNCSARTLRTKLGGHGLCYPAQSGPVWAAKGLELPRNVECYLGRALARGGDVLSKILLLVVALAGVTASAARAGTGPEVSHFTLANGLEVVVVPDHRAPVVTHMIWYKVGAADETPGKSGLAHFLE